MAASFEASRQKMEAEGLSSSIIKSFEASFVALASGASGLIPESTIGPAATLVDLDKDITPSVQPEPAYLGQTVVCKVSDVVIASLGRL